jgi:hypothetical protein
LNGYQPEPNASRDELRTSNVELRTSSVPRLGIRTFLLLFLLAFAARLTFATIRGWSQPHFGDWQLYVGEAEGLARTGTYSARKGGSFFPGPGYPFFLVLATLGHPDNIVWDKVAGCSAASFAAPLLALISLRLFRDRRIAIATGIAAAVYPPFLLFTSDLESETIFVPLLLGAGALLLAAADRRSKALALSSGAALGLAALTRPSALALAPLLAAPLLDRREPRERRGRVAAVAVLGFALTLAPWTIRNFIRYGEIIPISDEGAYTFFDGNSDWANRHYELKDRREVVGLDKEMARDKFRRLASMGIRPGTAAFDSPSRRSWALAQSALEDRRRDPAGTVRLYAHKIWHWIRPYPILFWEKPVVISATLLYTTLFIATAFGMKTASRRGAVWFSIAVLAISMAVHVAILVLWRYRVSYWDPVLLLYGVSGASRVFPLRAGVGRA